MDKYQRLALVLVVVLIGISYGTIAILLKISFVHNIATICVLVVLLLVVLRLNRWMRVHLTLAEYPNNDWYRKHLERNFDAIVLGDEVDARYFDRHKYMDKKVLFLFQRGQNLTASLLVLKGAFSILKPGGLVIIPNRKGSLKYVDAGIVDERLYYWAVSPYVFGSGRLSCMLKKVYTRIPVLLFRWNDLCYLCKKAVWKDIDKRELDKKEKAEAAWLKAQSEERLSTLEKAYMATLEDCRTFCVNRDLCLITPNYSIDE